MDGSSFKEGEAVKHESSINDIESANDSGISESEYFVGNGIQSARLFIHTASWELDRRDAMH